MRQEVRRGVSQGQGVLGCADYCATCEQLRFMHGGACAPGADAVITSELSKSRIVQGGRWWQMCSSRTCSLFLQSVPDCRGSAECGAFPAWRL